MSRPACQCSYTLVGLLYPPAGAKTLQQHVTQEFTCDQAGQLLHRQMRLHRTSSGRGGTAAQAAVLMGQGGSDGQAGRKLILLPAAAVAAAAAGGWSVPEQKWVASLLHVSFQ